MSGIFKSARDADRKKSGSEGAFRSAVLFSCMMGAEILGNLRDDRIVGGVEFQNCGVVAAFTERLGIVDFLDRHLPEPRRKGASFGVIAKGLIIQILHARFKRIGFGGLFFNNLPTNQLLGRGVLPSHLNDRRIGDFLQAVGDYGPSALYDAFVRECLVPQLPDGVNLHGGKVNFCIRQVANDDFALQLASSESDYKEHARYADRCEKLLKAYSFATVVDGSGTPLSMSPLDDGCIFQRPVYGNAFRKVAGELSALRNGMFFYMGDASFHSEMNPEEQGFRWVARVSEKNTKAACLLDTDEELVPSSDQNFRLLETSVTIGGAEQRWILVESGETEETVFAADSLKEPISSVSGTPLDDIWKRTPESGDLFSQPLRKIGAGDSQSCHKAECEGGQRRDAEKMMGRRQRRFVLATNSVGADAPSADGILALHNRQGRFVRGMRILMGKTMYLSDQKCVESFTRVGGMSFLLTLTLALYNHSESELRRRVAQSGEPMLDWRGKVTEHPTLKELFNLFDSACLLKATDGKKRVSSLLWMNESTEGAARRILSLLGEEFERYYEVDPEARRVVRELWRAAK